MKKLLVLMSLVSALVLAGCASTSVSSFSTEEPVITKSNKIVVFGDTKDVGFRKTIENDFVKEFSSNKVMIVSAINTFSPLKEYTEEEKLAKYEEIGATHILTVSGPVDGLYAYPNINFEVKLTSVESGDVIYIATGYSECEETPDYENAAKALAKKVCSDYLKLKKVKVVVEEPETVDESVEEVAEETEETENTEVAADEVEETPEVAE